VFTVAVPLVVPVGAFDGGNNGWWGFAEKTAFVRGALLPTCEAVANVNHPAKKTTTAASPTRIGVFIE